MAAAGGGPLSIRNPDPALEDEVAKLIREIKAYDVNIKANPRPMPSSQNGTDEEEMELQGEWQRLYELVQNLLHDEPERHDALMALLQPYAGRFGQPSQGNEAASQYGGKRNSRKSKSRKSKSRKSKSRKSKSKGHKASKSRK